MAMSCQALVQLLYNPNMAEQSLLRIGELSRRAGVSRELLRAWERRYGLLNPSRSAGGLRLYSLDDLARVERMQQLLAQGVAAAEAAAIAAKPDDGSSGLTERLPVARGDLAAALEAFDEPRAQSVLDELLSRATVETILSEVLLPYLAELGARWERGEVTVAQEHFATSVIRGRMLGLARGWGRGIGPVALLACLPGERHELGLLAFGLALRSQGWRIIYLGSDTPLETVERTANTVEPQLIVLSTRSGERVHAAMAELRELTRNHRVAIGGAGAERLDPASLEAFVLAGDPVSEAERVTASVQASR